MNFLSLLLQEAKPSTATHRNKKRRKLMQTQNFVANLINNSGTIVCVKVKVVTAESVVK